MKEEIPFIALNRNDNFKELSIEYLDAIAKQQLEKTQKKCMKSMR